MSSNIPRDMKSANISTSGPQALFSHMGRDATEEFEMLHDDEVIPKYAADIVIGRVQGQEITLEY